MSDLVLGAKCLAFHGPLLYEAKILKTLLPGESFARTKEGDEPIKSEEEVPKEVRKDKAYYIHYKGWKATWDEWVAVSRLRELTAENVALQRELRRTALASAQGTSSAQAGKKATEGPKSITTTATAGRAYKRRLETEVDAEDESLKLPEISILTPDSLKSLLVDDWELITKEHQLLSLPCKQNVDTLLDKFRLSLGRRNTVESEILNEFLSGIKMYFNRSLGNILLYRFERQQYLDLTRDPQTKDLDPSAIYGAEHLLRLMVSLPALIAQTTMDQQSVATLKEHLEQMLQFLEKHRSEFFLKLYENVSPAYEALAKSA